MKPVQRRGIIYSDRRLEYQEAIGGLSGGVSVDDLEWPWRSFFGYFKSFKVRHSGMCVWLLYRTWFVRRSAGRVLSCWQLCSSSIRSSVRNDIVTGCFSTSLCGTRLFHPSCSRWLSSSVLQCPQLHVQVSAVANWPVRRNSAVDRAWRSLWSSSRNRLQRSSVGAWRHCQLSCPSTAQFITLWASTSVELSR